MVSDLETRVICHQRGGGEETASPAGGRATLGPAALDAVQRESLNGVKSSGAAAGEGERPCHRGGSVGIFWTHRSLSESSSAGDGEKVNAVEDSR